MQPRRSVDKLPRDGAEGAAGLAAPAPLPHSLPRLAPREIHGPASAAVLPSLGAPFWAPAARTTLLVATDLTAILLAGTLAYVSWARAVLSQGADLYLGLLPLMVVFPVGYAGAGLYPGFGLGAVQSLRRFSHATTLGFLFLAAATFAFKLPALYSRMTFAIAWLATLALVPLARFAALALFTRFRWWGEPTVLVGDWQGPRWMVRAVGNGLSLGFRPVGVLETTPAGRDVEGLPVLGTLDDAPALAARGVRVALVWDEPATRRRIEALRARFRHVILVSGETELPVERAQVYNLGGAFGLEVTNGLLDPGPRILKRAFDATLGSVLFLLAIPVILVASLLVKLRSRGPFFYSQEREGLDGRAFRLVKIRTMHADAEERLEQTLAADAARREEWETKVKLADDPRIVPGIGTFLRGYSIDELPQLWSVVTGEMSLVGPRPFPEYHLARFPEPFRGLRRRVRPGITGMWQVMVRSDGDLDEQRAYDSYYIRNWSIWLDLHILVRTVVAVLRGRGAG